MRIASLIGRLDSGDFVDPVTGKVLSNVSTDLDKLIDRYNALVKSGGVAKTGKGEIQLRELRLLSTATAGGEFRARKIFKTIPPAQV